MSDSSAEAQAQNDALWRGFLTGENPLLRRGRSLFKLLPFPSSDRCKWCLAPFTGPSAPLMRLIGRRPWPKNQRWCSACEKLTREHPGGAELDLTLVFADVRGSTAMAEGMAPAAYREVMQRFYAAATRTFMRTDAIIDKLVGDEVIALYLPAFAGPDYARRAVESAVELLKTTGHGSAGEPWLPVGVGIHSGPAYIGSIGSEEGVIDFTALGDTVNVAARIVTQAGAGEILVSDAACRAAGLDAPRAERRQLDLRGHAEPVDVHVLGPG